VTKVPIPAPASGDFRFASHRVGADVWVVSLAGDCGDAAGADLERELASLPREGTTQAVIDLTSATTVRRGFLAGLVRGAREGRANGVATTVVSDDSEIWQALEESERDATLKLQRLLATGIRDALTARLS
jgi:hypothetical protein